MGACMWATFRQAANRSVPAPVDADTPHAPWWYDHIASQCEEFATRGGYTAIMLPPVHKTNSGSRITGDGYGFQGDHYDIGSRSQCYSVPTRFGNREQLLRLCAVARACGMDVYHDLVLHQIQGGASETWPGANGEPGRGRFPMRPSYFCNSGNGEVPHDRVMGDPDWPFGEEFAYTNARPDGELKRLTTEAVDWLMRTTGAMGARIDAATGLNAGFLKDLAMSSAMRGRYMVMEFADGNADNLCSAVANGIFASPPGVDGALSAFDFDAHYNKIKAMCENAGRFDMRQLANGFLDRMPQLAATFVDNPDTDTNGFAQVAFNKAAGYFYIMTSEGYPFTYYKDRSTDRGCYGMRDVIDNASWLQLMMASGGTQVRFADQQLFVYERTGGRRLLCAINNAPWGGWRQQWVQTGFGPNVRLHDYTGHADDLWTNDDGWVNLGVPQNVNGLGYVAYAPAGMERPIPVRGGAITQTTFGDSGTDRGDLDVPSLRSGVATRLPRIWCEANTEVRMHMRLQHAVGPYVCGMGLLDPSGSLLASSQSEQWRTTTRHRGWHTPTAAWYASTRNASDLQPFELDITYTAPRSI